MNNYNTRSTAPRTNRRAVVNLIVLFITVPIILVSLLLIGVTSLVTNAEEKNSEGFVETVGVLVGYSDPNYNGSSSPTYTPIYEYEVDGQTYLATPSYSLSKNLIKDTAIVQYNPDQPSQNAIRSNTIMATIQLIGIIIICICLGIIIFANIVVTFFKDKA